MMFGSKWEFNVSKEDFKSRMKRGEISEELAKAQQMLADLYAGKDTLKSPRYKDASKEDKIAWLRDQISQLTDGMRIVSDEEKEDKQDKFIGDNFDVKIDKEDTVTMPEPVRVEN
jgi:hypothetical protein